MTTNKIEPLNPHGAYVYKLHFDFDWNSLKPVCEKLVNSEYAKSTLIKNGRSSHLNKTQPHKIEQFRSFYTWLAPLIKNIFIEQLDYANVTMNYFISNSWVNLHGPGGATTLHNHANTFMVATAYLDLPENSGYMEMKDPLEYTKGMFYHDNHEWMWKEIPVVTGDVLIFPGWMQHRTQINNSSENRWVLTTNFVQEFKDSQ
jgi:uncharacterized protein (TIGR02466 family)